MGSDYEFIYPEWGGIYSALKTIKHWPSGLLPSEFGICQPDEDLAFMMGFDYWESLIENHQRELAHKKKR